MKGLFMLMPSRCAAIACGPMRMSRADSSQVAGVTASISWASRVMRRTGAMAASPVITPAFRPTLRAVACQASANPAGSARALS